MIDPQEWIRQQQQLLKKAWGWFLALGIFFIIMGMVALSVPILATYAVEQTLAFLFLISGVLQIIYSFQVRGWSGMLFSLITAALSIAVGAMMLADPVHAILALTLLLAIFLVAEGALKVVMSMQIRHTPNWFWIFMSGLFSLLLGGMIYAEFPSAAAWVLGMLVGINMLFNGWTLVMVSLAAKNASFPDGSAGTDSESTGPSDPV